MGVEAKTGIGEDMITIEIRSFKQLSTLICFLYFLPSTSFSPPICLILFSPKNKDLFLSTSPSLFLSHFSLSPFSTISHRGRPFFLFLERQDGQANAASGMAVSDECKLKFLELKTKRNYRFIIFVIENQEVVVEKVGNLEESYEDFSSSLPPDECRYAVFDFDFITDENCQKNKIFFIAWSPETSKVRNKMVYASRKDRFKGIGWNSSLKYKQLIQVN